MSEAASAQLSEPRFRRFLGIELQNSGAVAPRLAGPLSDQVAYVWIDMSQPATASMEVRVGAGPVARRAIQLSELGRDVASRLVAIAVAEMIRSQPARARKPPPPRGPTAEQLEAWAHAAPAVTFTGAGSAVVLTDGTLMGGSTASVGFRTDRVGQRVFGRWVGGSGPAGATGWLEAGLAVEMRWWVNPSWRVAVGALGSGAAIHLGAVRSIDGVHGTHDSWSARAGATASVETRISEGLWLGLGFEPAAILRTVPYDDASGQANRLRGLWMGLDLALHFDRRTMPQ